MPPTSPDGRALNTEGSLPVRLNVQPPGWDDFSSGKESDVEDDERPLTRDELKKKTTFRGSDTPHVSEVGWARAGQAVEAVSASSCTGGAKPLDEKVRERCTPRLSSTFSLVVFGSCLFVEQSFGNDESSVTSQILTYQSITHRALLLPLLSSLHFVRPRSSRTAHGPSHPASCSRD